MSNFSGFIESKEDADKQNGAVCNEDADKQIGQFAKKMPEASDNGSQPYRNAVRCFEMAGMGLSPNNISLPLW